MKGLVVLAIILLAWIISFVVREYNPVLGEILGMAMVQPFIIIVLLIVFLIVYNGFRKIFNKEKKDTKVEIFIEREGLTNSCDYSDIFLTKNVLTSDLIEYQMTNKENVLLWSGKCNLNQGKLHSMILYSGDINKEVIFQVIKEPSGLEYRLKDGQLTIGSIIIANNGLRFNNLDNNPIYTATLEVVNDDGLGAVADFLLSMDTLSSFSSASTVENFVLKDENDEILGKYYIALKNIDLTTDTNNKFDRRIAAIFSMFLDSALMGNLGR